MSSQNQLIQDLRDSDFKVRHTALFALEQSGVKSEVVLREVKIIAKNDPMAHLRQIAQLIIDKHNKLLQKRKSDKSDIVFSDRELLERIYSDIQKQKSVISEIKDQVGCVHNFIIAIIVILIFFFFLAFFI